jgi:hypothetical protein
MPAYFGASSTGARLSARLWRLYVPWSSIIIPLMHNLFSRARTVAFTRLIICFNLNLWLFKVSHHNYRLGRTMRHANTHVDGTSRLPTSSRLAWSKDGGQLVLFFDTYIQCVETEEKIWADACENCKPKKASPITFHCPVFLVQNIICVPTLHDDIFCFHFVTSLG